MVSKNSIWEYFNSRIYSILAKWVFELFMLWNVFFFRLIQRKTNYEVHFDASFKNVLLKITNEITTKLIFYIFTTQTKLILFNWDITKVHSV